MTLEPRGRIAGHRYTILYADDRTERAYRCLDCPGEVETEPGAAAFAKAHDPKAKPKAAKE